MASPVPGCPVCRHPHARWMDPVLFYGIRSPRFVAKLYRNLDRPALVKHRDVCLGAARAVPEEGGGGGG